MFEAHIDQPRSRVKALAQKFENYRITNSDGPQSDRENAHQHQGSAGFTPPSWKAGPASTQNHFPRHQTNYRNLTPAQKTQAVANGQRELMEMIKNMPETSYELSLKDLVEHSLIIEQKAVMETQPYESYTDDEEIELCKRSEGEKKTKKVITIANNNRKNKSEKTAQIYRSVSLDSGGPLLRMGFPVLWAQRKKTKRKSNNTNPGEPGLVNSASDGSRKSVDKEWWVKQKRFSGWGSRDSENGGISSNSGSTGSSGSSSSIRSIGDTRHGHTCAPSCWAIFRTGKGVTQK